MEQGGPELSPAGLREHLEALQAGVPERLIELLEIPLRVRAVGPHDFVDAASVAPGPDPLDQSPNDPRWALRMGGELPPWVSFWFLSVHAGGPIAHLLLGDRRRCMRVRAVLSEPGARELCWERAVKALERALRAPRFAAPAGPPRAAPATSRRCPRQKPEPPRRWLPGLLVLELDAEVQGTAPGSFHPLRDGFTVGQAPDSDLQLDGRLPDSRLRAFRPLHAKFRLRHGHVMILPACDKSLLRADGQSLPAYSPPQALTDGQRVQIGTVHFLFVERFPVAWLRERG